jgi:hypothetical protein
LLLLLLLLLLLRATECDECRNGGDTLFRPRLGVGEVEEEQCAKDGAFLIPQNASQDASSGIISDTHIEPNTTMVTHRRDGLDESMNETSAKPRSFSLSLQLFSFFLRRARPYDGQSQP